MTLPASSAMNSTLPTLSTLSLDVDKTSSTSGASITMTYSQVSDTQVLASAACQKPQDDCTGVHISQLRNSPPSPRNIDNSTSHDRSVATPNNHVFQSSRDDAYPKQHGSRDIDS